MSQILTDIHLLAWYIDSVAEPEYVTALYAGLVYSMQQQFGIPMLCSLRVENSGDENHFCTLKIPETYLDCTDISKAIENKEKCFAVEVCFNNVSLEFHGMLLSDQAYCYSVHALFEPSFDEGRFDDGLTH